MLLCCCYCSCFLHRPPHIAPKAVRTGPAHRHCCCRRPCARDHQARGFLATRDHELTHQVLCRPPLPWAPHTWRSLLGRTLDLDLPVRSLLRMEVIGLEHPASLPRCPLPVISLGPCDMKTQRKIRRSCHADKDKSETLLSLEVPEPKRRNQNPTHGTSAFKVVEIRNGVAQYFMSRPGLLNTRKTPSPTGAFLVCCLACVSPGQGLIPASTAQLGAATLLPSYWGSQTFLPFPGAAPGRGGNTPSAHPQPVGSLAPLMSQGSAIHSIPPLWVSPSPCVTSHCFLSQVLRPTHCLSLPGGAYPEETWFI
ncbi:hypothetical protein H920_00669 [Fukomys damarensis]|uniref:Uncharacterized protein n=1 Tax=Fukomys damarensis TaxID=885580 RepID=A0A091E0I0_FUKDA|nr:hypothetical protein H920_00669 [Fukomys damarensis]